MPPALIAYGVLSEEQAETVLPADCILLERQQRVIAFNESLRRHSEGAPRIESKARDEHAQPSSSSCRASGSLISSLALCPGGRRVLRLLR